MEKFTFKDILILWNDNWLSIENSAIKREFILDKGVVRTCKIVDKHRNMVVANENEQCDFSLIGINFPSNTNAVTNYKIMDISTQSCPTSIFEAEHVKVDIVMHDSVQEVKFVRRYIIYPQIPVISTHVSVSCLTSANIFWNRRTIEFNQALPVERLESCVDIINLDGAFAIEKIVEFAARTDLTNHLVTEHNKIENLMHGNLLFANSNSNSGLFLLQEAPPSAERRDFELHDFRINSRHIFSCNWGLEPADIAPKELWSYRHVIGISDGNNSSLLKKYLNLRFPFDIKKNTSVMVNPWGCGCFRTLLNEEFLHDEIRATALLHANQYQIDDGWEKGEFLREFELNNRFPKKGFWEINKKLLPNTFAPLCETAQKNGVELALWVAPSAHCQYRDWQEFSDMVYHYHKEYGFNNFKIDFVRIRTKESEDNLEKMLKSLREKSQGEIYFNLDTTAGQRPGYFMFLEYGNIFLENRYICRNGGLGYHPEDTLNNLWNLSKYTRTQSLQIEFTDPDIINKEFYLAKKRSLPTDYPSDYWVAITMFANPLAWFTPSKLSAKNLETFRDVIDLHLKYKEEIFAGEILPIGEEPSGSSIAGFLSHNHQTNSGFILLFCEVNAPLQSRVKLPLLDKAKEYRLFELSLAGELPVSRLSNATLNIDFANKASWKLYKY